MAPSKGRQARRSSRSAARTARKAKRRVAPAATELVGTFDEAIAAAAAAEENGQFGDAVQAYARAAAIQPDNAEAREAYAAACLEDGRPDDAERELRVAIELAPAGFEKYTYLAQLLGNTREALDCFQTGIECIRAERVAAEAAKELDRASNLLQFEASAHCAVAEIALGIIEDSNDPAVAAEMDGQVESAVMAALAVSAKGSDGEIEAILSLANLRLSQARREEAAAAMGHVFESMQEGLQILESEETTDQTVLAGLNLLPSVEIRIAVGKQLVEVEMWDRAISVLASVMWECDFNVEVWYLLAVAYWQLGDADETRAALENTRRVLKSPEGHDGDLEESMIDKLYSALEPGKEQAAENKRAEGDQDRDMVCD